MHRKILTALVGTALFASLAAAQTVPSTPTPSVTPAQITPSPAAADAPPAPSAPAPRSAPQALPVIQTVAEPRDTPWTAGTIQLQVDATDTVRRIIAVTETIPVSGSGPLTLLLPQWLPGHHSPKGTIDKLAGLTITTAEGTPVSWQRDALNVFAFHIAVPGGTGSIVAHFQFLAPTRANQGRVVMTDSLLDLQWDSLSLYPAGYYVRGIPIEASLTLPMGWSAAGALRGTTRTAGMTSVTSYDATDYETLVDSPVFAGRYYRGIDLGHDVTLNLFADAPEELIAKPEQIAAHKKLVDEALALFGARHFDHYDFLLALSDTLGGIGLEHHRESENAVGTGYFTRWDDGPGSRNILPHEFTHSWNGKFRRPDLLWTPDYSTPMQDSLLWVYEGQTQFWGYVLGARSGLYTKQQTLDALASIAARLDTVRGREWRPLEDTTYDPIIAQRQPEPWSSWQRSEDYYNEGLMVWLEADGIIRQQTQGAQGLDDFAKAFFGMKDSDWGTLTYDRQDVIDTLNKIAPYDWAGFFAQRIDRTNQAVDKAGFALGGYRLVYGDTPNSVTHGRETSGKYVDQSYGVGLIVGDDGDVKTVVWNSPAFQAGMTVGTRIMAVDGTEYSADVFRKGLRDATDKSRPLSLIIKQGKRYRIITLDYSGGIRYPRLEKTGEGETSLDRLLEPRTSEAHVNQPKSAGTS